MIIDFVLLLMVISGIAGILSPIVFRKRGASNGILGTTTRRGIAISAICFELMAFWSGVAMLVHNSSNYLTAIGCIGTLTIINGMYFILIYFSLPR